MILGRRDTRLLSAAFLVVGWVAAGAARAADPSPPETSAIFDEDASGIRIETPSRYNVSGITVSAWVKLASHRQPQVVVNRGERGELFTLYSSSTSAAPIASRRRSGRRPDGGRISSAPTTARPSSSTSTESGSAGKRRREPFPTATRPWWSGLVSRVRTS